MWRRPPPLLCGSWASMITHLINGESKHIGRRFPKYSSLASAATARPQIAPSSEDEQKRTAASFSTSSEVCFDSVHYDQALETLNDLRREPNRAQGLRQDAATCAEIVRVLCGSDVEKKLIPLISEIISSGNDSDFALLAMFGFLSKVQNCGNLVNVAFDTVIREYAHLEMPDRAARTFFQLCAHGYVPCLNTCNFLMNLLVRCGDTKLVDDVYSQIKRSEVSLKLCTFRILINALFIPGKSAKLHHDLVWEMRQEGIEPDSSIFLEVVCGICAHGMPDYGYKLLKSAGSLGISMTTIEYNLVISGFCKMEKLCEAEEVLEDMVKQGVPPNVHTYGSLIGGYCSSRNILRVASLRDEMALRGIKTNCVIESSILRCLSELGRNVEVLELFEKYKNSGQIVDKVLYNIAIDAQCKLGKMEEAAEMFQEMKGCGLVPDKVHYTTLINGYCRQREIDNAWKTFSCMIDVGHKPDVVTYNILASGFSESGFVKVTHDLLHHMLDHGVEPSSVTFATVIKGFCRGGNLSEAKHLFESLQQMEGVNTPVIFSAMVSGYLELGHTIKAYNLFIKLCKYGNLVDEITYSKLINALCEGGAVQRMLQVFELTTGMGFTPNESTCCILISAFAGTGNMREAQYFFDDMISRGLSPDVVVYSTLVNGYCKQNCLPKACSLFIEMNEKGIKPDIAIHTVLLDTYLKDNLKQGHLIVNKRNGNLINAIQSHLLDNMKGIDLLRDTFCYTVLIDDHCKTGHIEDAHRLFEKMMRSLIPDVVTCTSLLSFYSIHGEVDKAKDIFDEMLHRGIQPDAILFFAFEEILKKAERLGPSC